MFFFIIIILHIFCPKTNTEEQEDLAFSFGIRCIPTVIAVRERIGVFQQAGTMHPEMLKELVEKVESLDMEDVLKSAQST